MIFFNLHQAELHHVFFWVNFPFFHKSPKVTKMKNFWRTGVIGHSDPL